MNQNAYKMILNINANVKTKAILETIAKNVNNLIYNYKIQNKNRFQKNLIKDNACWNVTCEGCSPLYENSLEFECTCRKKSFDSSCKSGKLRKCKVLNQL